MKKIEETLNTIIKKHFIEEVSIERVKQGFIYFYLNSFLEISKLKQLSKEKYKAFILNGSFGLKIKVNS